MNEVLSQQFHVDGSRQLTGPFKYHVYLGCCPSDAAIMHKLRMRLEKDHIKCSSRCDPNFPERAFQSLIKEGTNRSEKCLIYVTDDYMEELNELVSHKAWSGYELREVLNKTSRISHDVIIVLKSKNLTKDIPQDLGGCTALEVNEEMMENDRIFLSNLEREILRELHPSLVTMPKQNVGYGAAFGYFYGFLRLVLPGFRKRLLEQSLSNNKEMAETTVQKMLIILPESCFCPPKFPEEFIHTGKYVNLLANRAGTEKRDYKTSLYRVRDETDDKDYYAACEVATPLLTMYEMQFYGLSGMSREELYSERDAFYVVLNSILSHPGNRACHQQYKVLFWSSDPEFCHVDGNKSETVELYDFLLPIIKQEVENQKTSDGEFSEKSCNSNSAGAIKCEKTTFETIPVKGPIPSVAYASNLTYDLDVVNDQSRGHCIIINCRKFKTLEERLGSKEDIPKLKDLFGNHLHFMCQVREDVTAISLTNLLLEVSKVDHSAFKAFVCVIMTHGELGTLYTSDDEPVPILDVVEFFGDCPTLRGKPKMFFINACQTGRQEVEQSQVISEGSVGNSDIVGKGNIAVNETAAEGTILDEVEGSPWSGGAESSLDTCTVPTMQSDVGHSRCIANRALYVPSRPDFLMSYATLPGAVAYRHKESGTFYVTHLCQHLKEGLEIDQALKKVTDSVRKDLARQKEAGNDSRFQWPFHLSTMYKQIYM